MAPPSCARPRRCGRRGALLALALLAGLAQHAQAKEGDANDRLFYAARAGDVKEALKALEEGADLDRRAPGKSGQKRTPLMEATLGGNAGVAEVLLKRGADPHIPEYEGYTPVHGAAFQGRTEVMELLMAAGVDPLGNKMHADGFDPAHRCCFKSGKSQEHADTLEVLIKHGYDALRLLEKKMCVVRPPGDPVRRVVQDAVGDKEFANAYDTHLYGGAYQQEQQLAQAVQNEL